MLRLRDALAPLRFGGRVAHVYRPLEYAWAATEQYLRRYGQAPKPLLLVGMNPGPWGMTQTGVPFGAVPLVRDWLGIEADIEPPAEQHPARPIEGFACARNEVSGQRLWGWMRERFGTPQAMARAVFVWGFCPLTFLAESGANLTPDTLRKAEREPLEAHCGAALREMVAALEPTHVVGIGVWAEARAREALAGLPLTFGRILHPSPASPLANAGFARKADTALHDLLGARWPLDAPGG